jgi:hypothetical protein
MHKESVWCDVPRREEVEQFERNAFVVRITEEIAQS